MEENERKVSLMEFSSDDIPDSQLTEVISITMICRLCANESEKLISIYGEDGLSNDLPNKMNLYLPIKVSENDDLPLQCCWQCASTVLAWHDLVVTSVEAQRRLRSYQLISHKQLEGIQYDEVGNDEDIDCHTDDDGMAESQSFTNTSTDQSSISFRNSTSPPTKNVKTTRTTDKIPTNHTNKTNSNTLHSERDEERVSTIKTDNEEPIEEVESSFEERPDEFIQESAYTYACVFCPTIFLTQEDIDTHIASDHRGGHELKDMKVALVKPSEGEVEIDTKIPQDLLFNNELVEDLLNSSRVTDTDGKMSFSCRECGQNFQYKYALLWHLAAHSGEKPVTLNVEQLDGGVEKSKHELGGATLIYKLQKSNQDTSLNSEKPTPTVHSADEIPTEAGLGLRSGVRSSSPNKKLRIKIPDFIKVNKKFPDPKRKNKSRFAEEPLVGEVVLKTNSLIKGKQDGGDNNNETLILPDSYGGNIEIIYEDKQSEQQISTFLSDNLDKSIVSKEENPREKLREKHTKLDHAIVNKAKVVIGKKTFYNCKDCGKKLHSPYTYMSHIRIHTGERAYSCSDCGKQFRIKQGLINHVKETHKKIKPFQCDFCGNMFGTRINLQEHRRTHTNERPHVCESCGKTFRQKSALFIHKRSHTDVFPFRCASCDKAFRTKSHLTGHLRIHTGEKPYQCDECGRRFVSKSELKRHKLTHSSDWPFKCEVCGVRFKLQRYLKGHVRSQHEGKRKRL